MGSPSGRGQSIPILVAPTGGMNSYFPMPFAREHADRIGSDHPDDVDAVFFQVDYTVGDESRRTSGPSTHNGDGATPPPATATTTSSSTA